MFGESQAEALAKRFDIPNVLLLPIDPAYAQAIDAGAAETLSLPEIETFIKSLI